VTLPEPILDRLSELLATHLGLHYPQERWADLDRGIAAASSRLGISNTESFAYRLLAAPLTHQEIETLAACMTVGETYFFRERRSLDALEQQILPGFLRARAVGERRLRIWSAGCCTGEEPYSIAMLLDRLIAEANAWNITLLATDINPAFLRKAAEGEYGAWSFRDTPDWVRDRYFRPRKNGRFKLDERIRKRVAFASLNLASDAYPSLTNGTNAMDVILCRNVLMYFSAERARMVVDNFHHALVDGGWLIVSPAETSSALFSEFTAVEFEGAILYRKDASAAAPHFVNHISAPVVDSLQESRHFAGGNILEAETFQPIQAANPPADSGDDSVPTPAESNQLSRAARDCANRGQLGEAAEWCRQAIAADKLNPTYQYLLAVIRQEQGEGDDAAQSLMRALYLDPDFVLAHYALGNLCRSKGRHIEAQRHFDNALASLRTHPLDEILPESDGLTAGRLAEIIESIRASCNAPCRQPVITARSAVKRGLS
jgi:chemotaxis protein methyltransferase CheR